MKKMKVNNLHTPFMMEASLADVTRDFLWFLLLFLDFFSFSISSFR